MHAVKQSLTIALIHGWATPSNVWQPLASRLQDDGFEVFVHDLPGYGIRRQENGVLSFEELVADAINRIPENSIWIGWSLGAMIGLAATTIENSTMQGLIAVSATANFCDSPNSTQALNLLRQDTQTDANQAVRRFHLSMPSPSNRRAVSKQVSAARETGDIAVETLLAGLKILAETDLRDMLNRIQTPLRLICGSEDKIIASSASELIFEAVGRTKLITLPCGHVPFLECPELFYESLLEFVNAQPK
jgi:pimeloyl-[acyl-carrier protein] methyl ester esterase